MASTIVTVALASTPPLSGSETVNSLSSAIEPPPPSKVLVPGAVTVGATCTVSTVLATVPLFSVPSFTDQSIVRELSEPPLVGSVSVGVEPNLIESSAAWYVERLAVPLRVSAPDVKVSPSPPNVPTVSVSEERRPVVMAIVALTRVVLDGSVTTAPESITTAAPPPLKFTVPLAVTVGVLWISTMVPVPASSSVIRFDAVLPPGTETVSVTPLLITVRTFETTCAVAPAWNVRPDRSITAPVPNALTVLLNCVPLVRSALSISNRPPPVPNVIAPEPAAWVPPRSSVLAALIDDPPSNVLEPVSFTSPPPAITSLPCVALAPVPEEPSSSAITPLTVNVCPLPGANVTPWAVPVLLF